MIHRRAINSPRRKLLMADYKRTKSLMRAALEAHGAEIRAEFEDVVSDWSDESRPSFTVEVKVKPTEIRVEVRPHKRRKTSRIFGYVDRGTRGPYPIRPKRTNKSGRLAFQTGYQPKTLPVARAHVGPGKAFGPWTRPQAVQHPGIKARQFSATVQQRARPKFTRRVENTFRHLERDAQRKG